MGSQIFILTSKIPQFSNPRPMEMSLSESLNYASTIIGIVLWSILISHHPATTFYTFSSPSKIKPISQ